MNPQWRISIQFKILLVLSAVVIAAVALYLYLASRIFYEDKTLLIYELNQTGVRTQGNDIENNIRRVVDQLRMLAASEVKGLSHELLPLFGGKDADFVRVGILSRNRAGNVRDRTLGFWPKRLAHHSHDSDYLKRARETAPIPIDEVLKQGVWVRNATPQVEEAIPIMTIATLAGRGDRVIYADLRMDRILSGFSSEGMAQIYLMDSAGHLLAHSDQKRVLSGESLSEDPLMKAAVSSRVRSEVRRFESTEKTYVGSFYRIGFGNLVVASRIELEEAFYAARVLMKKSLLYALLVITVAFLIALFLSHSLTVPIQKMVEATRRIATGDFNIAIPITTRDELALLASSFNSMTSDLRVSRDQIQEYSRDLEKKVQDRTAKLESQNIAIKEAQEALVRTTRLASVGEVAGRAAHEVLNPLTGIATRLEIIRNQRLQADTDDLSLLKEISEGWNRDYQEKGLEGFMQALSVPSSTMEGKTLLEEDLQNLQAIASDSLKRVEQRKNDIDFLMRECGRISKIVNGMRQLTRVSGNRGKIDAHRFLQETVATMSDLLSKNKISCETHFCSESTFIDADSDELLQVMSNLLRNSMQAINEGRLKGAPVGEPAKIWITTQVIASDSGKRLHLRVSDNGPGIAPENASKIFEPSFTTKSMSEGTGLGLAICRRFIRAYEGDIQLEKSEPGAETIFLIDLPALLAADTPSDTSGEMEQNHGTA